MKGQSAVETIISFGVVLLIVITLYTFLLYPRINETNYSQSYYSAKNVCSDLASTINTVVYNGNGFNQKFSPPSALYGRSYNITVYPQLVGVSWDKGTVFCQFRARNISFRGSYPPFLLNLTDHILNNSDGVVRIA
jgi:hypothetical protein